MKLSNISLAVAALMVTTSAFAADRFDGLEIRVTDLEYNTKLLNNHVDYLKNIGFQEEKAKTATNIDNITANADDIAANKQDIAVNKQDIKDTNQRLGKIDSDVSALNNRVKNVDNALKRGLAAQSALNGLFQPYSVGKFNASMALGGYDSKTAIAVGSGYRFNENFAAKSGLAFNTENAEGVSYNVGFNYEW